MASPFETLVAAATRAPSGDNTQPWRFVVDEGAGRIDIVLDETRDPSPMNRGLGMARIAVGAAMETLLRTARDNGWEARPESPRGSALASVLLLGETPSTVTIHQTILDRATNRRLYECRQVPPATIARLQRETPPVEGVRTHWLLDPGQRTALAEIIGAADALMFGLASMRRAFLANVRFDAPADAEVEEGLSVASLELSFFERLALRPLGSLPDWLLKCSGALRGFKAKARKLVKHASGVCIVTAPDDASPTDVRVGRTVQRAWLSLVDHGLVAQPMMSLPVLHNFVQQAPLPGEENFVRECVEELVRALRAAAPDLGDDRPAFVLRFGYAPPPSGRVGRRPVSQVSQAAPWEPLVVAGHPGVRL